MAKKSDGRKAETGHGHGRDKSEEKAQKIKKDDPNKVAEQKRD